MPRKCEAPHSGAALLRRISVFAGGENLGAGAIHLPRVFKSPEPKKKDTLLACLSFWCERRDLNPHGSYSASTSSWCVCRFRHPRIFTDTTCKCKDYYSIAENTCQGIAHKILRHHQSFPKRLLRPPPHNIKWWGNAGLSHKIPLGEDN